MKTGIRSCASRPAPAPPRSSLPFLPVLLFFHQGHEGQRSRSTPVGQSRCSRSRLCCPCKRKLLVWTDFISRATEKQLL